MREGAEFRKLMLQVVRPHMTFHKSMQRILRKNNAGITFKTLPVLSCLWHEQIISQQLLAERIEKKQGMSDQPNESFGEERIGPRGTGDGQRKHETMLLELKGGYDVLKNV